MVNNKKKILFFLPPSVGGAERVTITISRMLPIHDYSIEYYIVGKEKRQIESFIHDSSLIHHIKISSIWDFTTTKIYCVLKKEKPSFKVPASGSETKTLPRIHKPSGYRAL